MGNTTNPHAQAFGGSGGAIYIDGSGGGQLVIRRSTFTNNTASWAAGAIHTFLYGGGTAMTIEDSTFTGNSTFTNGGAIYHQGGGLTVARSTFSGNVTSGQGGALWLLQASPTTITNSTFTGNQAVGIPPNFGSSGLGGAILINASNVVTITHSTIANNHADWVGGGITGGMGFGSTTTLRGTIVAQNTANNGGNPWNIAHNCSTQLLDGGGNFQFPARQNPGDSNDPNCTGAVTIANPLLGPLADNGGPTPTRALLPGSPARNAVASGCPPPATDQRGVARPQDGACDAGAYEVPVTVGVAHVSGLEGTGGASTLTFLPSLSVPAAQTVTVDYATTPGTAAAGTDFLPVSGTLTFPPGVTAVPVPVGLVSDALDEADETFSLVLSNPNNALLGAATATGTILDDDPTPTLAALGCAAAEGNAPGATCTFSAVLSAPSGRTVEVGYTTSDGTATAPADYVAPAGTLTFPPGTTSGTVPVSLVGDLLDEPNETFHFVLCPATAAGIATASASGWILDDDGGAFALHELGHGVSRHETLAGGADVFLLSQAPRTSWEVMVDGASGDVGAGAGPLVQRLGPDLAAVVQAAAAAGSGPARTLRWRNDTAQPRDDYVRVASAGCATDCGADDVYRIRVHETTASLSRFNAAGQTTVVVLQNLSGGPVSGTLHFWAPSGSLLGSSPFSLAARALLTLNCASVPGVAGQSGAVTVVHDGGYGGLAGKAVALDPASGLAFDTPLTYRPR